jgi:hypothetical protein
LIGVEFLEKKYELISTSILHYSNLSSQDNKNSKAHRLSDMNRKNKVKNFNNASEVKPELTHVCFNYDS